MEICKKISAQNTYSLLNIQSTNQLRGICMIMIILHHAYLDVIKLNEYYFDKLPQCLLEFGYWGTGIFFFLSGYGMFFSLIKHTISPQQHYYLKKIKKLFIPFLACWIIYLFIDLILNNSTPTFKTIIDFISLAKPYSEAWFYKVIVAAYIILFISFRFIHSNSLKLFTILFFCLIYIIWAKNIGLGSYWYNSILNLPLGLFFAYKINWIRSFNPIIILFISILGFYISNGLSPIFTSIFFTLIAVYLTIYITKKSKILLFIGQNSLLFYLFQTPIPLYSHITNPYILFMTFFIQRFFEKSILIYFYNRLIEKFKLYD